MSVTQRSIRRAAAELGRALAAQKLSVATAESCTGGLVSAAITSIPGSSNWFERGFVTYSNAAKTELLGVSWAILERQGAVSEAAVRAMVRGALAHSRADLAVAITGIAGPGGGTAEKPVGTVWIAWLRRGRTPRLLRRRFRGDRKAVRDQSTVVALKGLIRLAKNASIGARRRSK